MQSIFHGLVKTTPKEIVEALNILLRENENLHFGDTHWKRKEKFLIINQLNTQVSNTFLKSRFHSHICLGREVIHQIP